MSPFKYAQWPAPALRDECVTSTTPGPVQVRPYLVIMAIGNSAE